MGKRTLGGAAKKAAKFEERLEVVMQALRSVEWGLDTRHRDILCAMGPKALAVPLDERHEYEDTVVSEIEDVFFSLEKGVQDAFEVARETAEHHMDNKDMAAKTKAEALTSLQAAEKKIPQFNADLVASERSMGHLRRAWEQAKKSEKAVEAAQKAADYVANRPRRSTGGSPRKQAVEEAEKHLQKAIEKEKAEKEVQDKDGSVKILETRLFEAEQAVRTARAKLKAGIEDREAAKRTLANAERTLIQLQAHTEDVREEYLRTQEEFKEFYQDLSAFRYLQAWNVGCNFEPPEDWTPEEVHKRPRLLDEPPLVVIDPVGVPARRKGTR